MPSCARYTGSWPQLLNLADELDAEHNERVYRPPPAEPLCFVAEHEHGDCVYAGDEEREVITKLFKSSLFEMLQSSPRLVFNRVNWCDVELARLALVLPLCSSLTELQVANNTIGDQGVIALAEALNQLPGLEVLSLASNTIGDPGASRLAGALTDGALQNSLRKLDLSTNNIGDKGALNLAGAISGGAIRRCKTVGLKGNPASAMARKAVTKAIKVRACEAAAHRLTCTRARAHAPPSRGGWLLVGSYPRVLWCCVQAAAKKNAD